MEEIIKSVLYNYSLKDFLGDISSKEINRKLRAATGLANINASLLHNEIVVEYKRPEDETMQVISFNIRNE